MKKFWQFTLAALITSPLVGMVVYCAERAIINAQVATTPLEAGKKLPPEFTQLVVTEGIGRGPQIRGVYRVGEDEIRFVTARGARISALEQASGAGAFEVDACFIARDGRTLVTVAGGHEVMIPECRAFTGEAADSENSPPSTPEEMRLVRDAMRAIAELPFRREYELEQRALTSTLAFSVFADSLDRVLSDQRYEEQPTGEVVIGPDEIGGHVIGVP